VKASGRTAVRGRGLGIDGPEGIRRSRRAWNARASTLSITVLGFLTGIFLYVDGSPMQDVAAILVTAVLTGVGYLLARAGRVVLSMLLVTAVILAEQLFVVAVDHSITVTPFFAPLVVLIASTALSSGWTWAVYGMALATVLGEGWIGGVYHSTDPAIRGVFVGALTLLTVTAVISYLYARGMENVLALAEQRDAERLRLAERLQKAERMEALGRLAGGVAHDFNNLLVVIGGSAELAMSELPATHPATRELMHVVEATERAAAVTRQLLAFSRKQVVGTERVDPWRTLDDLRELVPRLVGEKVKVRFEMHRAESTVRISSTQLEQLVLNLAANARDAMPSGGTLTLRVQPRIVEPEEVPSLKPGEYVELTVSDTGSGMTREVREHLFEPFFTTKEAGRGTGLGLATCFGIATAAGGTITVQSEPGEGATLCVLLPAVGEEDGLRSSPTGSWNDTEPGGKILVVDDDERILRICRRILESRGFEVHEASDAAASLEIAEREPNLDCILTDVVLGTDDGIALLGKLRVHQPHARLIVMSGYTPEPERAEALADQGAQFLPKPFSKRQLLAAAGAPTAAPADNGEPTG